MKRKSLLMMMLVALCLPLAMNAQTKSLTKSANGLPKLEMKAKAAPSNPLLSRLDSSKEAALEELEINNTRAIGDYELVTASQSNWSGTYVLAYLASTTQARVMTGRAGNNTNTYGTGTLITMTNNTLSASNVSDYAMTIAADGNYYTIKFGNYYLGAKNGNYLLFSTTTPTTDAYRWTIAYLNNTLTITNASYTTRQIKWNSANNGLRFACYTSGQQDISLFKLNDGCSAPEDFAASNVTTTSVTLSWTETGTSEEWAILYMCDEDTEAQVEFANTNPYTLTGLNPNTYYIAEVIPLCGDYDQESDVIEFTTEDLPCAQPSNLNVTAMTPSSATVSWSGEADSYTLQYRPAAENGGVTFFDDFESSNLNNWQWTTYTQQGSFSGYGWFAYNPVTLGLSSATTHSGEICALSLSYDGSSDITADNYLVTPQVTLGGTLKFWIMSNYSDEYEVLLSTRGNAVANFTTTLQAMSAAPASWTEVSIDLSSYDGQQGYIAIHHYQFGGFVLFLDDFGIYGEAQDAEPWVTVNNATSPYTITGLDGETTYEWQVQGDCGTDGTSLWASSTFTTPSACGAPSGLTTTNITGTSATLSWAEALEQYNVTYTKGFVYDFESATPWVVDSFDPCTTYDGDQTQCYGLEGSEVTNFPFTGACIAFQNGISTNLAAHSGNAFGMMVSPASNTVSANDWFILPELTIESGDVFSFWAREITTNYGAEVINVGVYGSSQGTFSAYLAQNVEVASTDWTQYSYDLSAYAGQTIQLAINYISLDIFGFMFDDLFVGNPNWSTPVSVTGSTYTLEGLSMNTNYVWQVQGVNCDGNGSTTDWSSASFTTIDGILVESITAADVNVLVGATASINPTVLPADATNPAVTYTSADEAIATVTANGVVTGVAVGSTTITIAATDGSGVTATINVTVTGIDVTEITAADITVVNGETATISYTVLPANATDPSVTFASADETIATVDENGVITGVAVGETTVTIVSVSNPEVTAEITVTVTSNPNAVQFTVIAPENAHPGDVITVEAYLNAPTSGNYNGFTGLVLGLHFDTDAFEAYGNPVNGPVASACMMTYPGLPNPTHPDMVQLACVMTPGNPNTTTGLVFSMQFTVLEEVELGSYEFYAEPTAAYNFVYNPDTAPVQIPYEYVPSTVNITTVETYTKHIIGYGTGTGNWYLIASPIGNVAPTEVTNMLSNSYDLYYFDQDTDGYGNEWINYKGDANNDMGDFSLEIGKGYLYANSLDVDLIFTGTCQATESTYPVQLKRHDNARFAGWNLVGNPYTESAYFEDNRDFYTMNSTATAFELIGSEDARHIEAMEGVFVIAEVDNEEVVFTTIAPAKTGNRLALNLSQGNNVIDRAFIRFGECRQLPKLQFNQSSTKVYIPMDDKDYAVVRAEEIGEMPLNFKAESNGTYSLNLSTDNVEFAYLHLIDNLTGNDVDLLKTPSYSFEASTTDYESRFKLVFATGNNSNDDNFAFFSNGSFVINNEGEATLQVIDVTGRVLKSETINGCANVNVDGAAGVYMLRLINGDNMKVQKVIVK